jgi:uncharacterized protein (DUF697 family)
MSKNVVELNADRDGQQDTEAEGSDGKPAILRAVELIISHPSRIKAAAHSLHGKYHCRHGEKLHADDIREMVARRIIHKYSYLAACSGGATALAGVVPGLGTIISTFGGATADTAMCVKFQVEMTMALATLYGHDVETEEAQHMCFIVAGVGLTSTAAKGGAKKITAKTFSRMVNQRLSGASVATVKALFKTVGVTFTKKAVVKAIPFGVGAMVGFSTNKGLTWYVGQKTHDFFKTNRAEAPAAPE